MIHGGEVEHEYESTLTYKYFQFAYQRINIHPVLFTVNKSWIATSDTQPDQKEGCNVVCVFFRRKKMQTLKGSEVVKETLLETEQHIGDNGFC